jgi:hypothetical protein
MEPKRRSLAIRNVRQLLSKTLSPAIGTFRNFEPKRWSYATAKFRKYRAATLIARDQNFSKKYRTKIDRQRVLFFRKFWSCKFWVQGWFHLKIWIFCQYAGQNWKRKDERPDSSILIPSCLNNAPLRGNYTKNLLFSTSHAGWRKM